MNDILISIIIPVYNVEKYVITCLESVRKQQSEGYEVIIVDDGSTDQSAKLVNDFILKYQLENFKYYFKNNGGLSSARNFGVKKSNGNYIWFIDSDDIITDGAINYFKKMIKEKEPDLIRTKYVEFKDTIPQTNDFEYIENFFNNGFEYVKKCIKEKNYYIVVCTSLIKKELFSKLNLHFTEGIFFEDQIFSAQMLLNSNLNIIDSNRISYLYRQNFNSISNTFSLKKGLDMIWVINNLYEVLRDKCIGTKYNEKEFWALPAYAFSYLTTIYNNVSKENQIILKNKINNDIKKKIFKTNSYRFQTDIQNKVFLFSPKILKILLKIYNGVK